METPQSIEQDLEAKALLLATMPNGYDDKVDEPGKKYVDEMANKLQGLSSSELKVLATLNQKARVNHLDLPSLTVTFNADQSRDTELHIGKYGRKWHEEFDQTGLKSKRWQDIPGEPVLEEYDSRTRNLTTRKTGKELERHGSCPTNGTVPGMEEANASLQYSFNDSAIAITSNFNSVTTNLKSRELECPKFVVNEKYDPETKNLQERSWETSDRRKFIQQYDPQTQSLIKQVWEIEPNGAHFDTYFDPVTKHQVREEIVSSEGKVLSLKKYDPQTGNLLLVNPPGGGIERYDRLTKNLIYKQWSEDKGILSPDLIHLRSSYDSVTGAALSTEAFSFKEMRWIPYK